MPQPVSGMRIAHGLMHRRSQDFGLGGGLNRKSQFTGNDVIKKFQKERRFMGQTMKDQNVGV